MFGGGRWHNIQMVRSSLVVALVAACGGASTRPGPTKTAATSQISQPPAEIVAGRESPEEQREPEGGAGDSAADPVDAGDGTGSTQVPTVTVGAPATGNPDKEVVRRVVRTHIGEIRTCYETALQQQPDLAGTVVATFTIAPDGRVAHASASGLHPDVEGCIAARISTWKFPSPSGGGALHINYPFVLRQES